MPGRNQDDALARLFVRGVLPIPPGRFAPFSSSSNYIVCTVCGARGLGPVEPTVVGRWHVTARRWALSHMVDHPFRCSCGARFLTVGQWASHAVSERPHHALACQDDVDAKSPDAGAVV